MDNDETNETNELDELVDNLDTYEEAVTPEEETTTEETNLSEVDELKKKLATTEAQKKHWKNKAEKTVAPKKETKLDLSSTDLYALMTEKIPQEDVDDVVKASKALGISIPEALKSPILKGILSDKAEKRTTAEMTNTGNTRTGPKEITKDELLRNSEKGILPEDEEEIERLISAKLNN